MDEEKPELELEPVSESENKWKPSPEVEEVAEAIVGETLPLNLRPSPAQIEDVYQIAYNLYQSGKYKEASSFFHLLSLTNPKEPRYAMGVAACYHMMKDYNSAIDAYTFASILDPDNPFPQYHLADCYIHSREPVGAYVALEMALTRCKKDARYRALSDRVTVMLNRLKSEFAEKKAQGSSSFRGEDIPI